jgi:hypothetical protein
MEELTKYLAPENEQKFLEFHNWGEVARILFRNLHVAASGKADSVEITSDTITFVREGRTVGTTPIAAFKNAQVSFRERLVQFIDKDDILARHIRIVERTPEKVVAEFIS